jgi:hypothetical protein
MAITTYTELKSAVADWLNRSDLTAVIPSFIALAESYFNQEERLRNQKSIVRATATFDQEYEALPGDYLEMLNLTNQTTVPFQKVQFLSLNQWDDYKRDFTTLQVPKYYTIVGNQLQLLPVPGSSITAEMVYYAKIPALSDSNAANWLLTNHPEVYLYGTLIQAAPYLKDDDRIATWNAMLERSLDNIHQADDRALYAGSVIKTRARPF